MYIRVLLINYSSAQLFPFKYIIKLGEVDLCSSWWKQIFDFLIGRPQSVRLAINTWSMQTISTRAPEGCVFSLLLYSLYPWLCCQTQLQCHLQICRWYHHYWQDQLVHRRKINNTVERCQNDNLALNINTINELIVDFRKGRLKNHALIFTGETAGERVNRFQDPAHTHFWWSFQGSANWCNHTETPPMLLLPQKSEEIRHIAMNISHFYKCMAGEHADWLHHRLVWKFECSRMREAAERGEHCSSIPGTNLPTIERIYKKLCLKKTANITIDPHHSDEVPLSLLPLGWRWSLRTITSMAKDGFFPYTHQIFELSYNL